MRKTAAKTRPGRKGKAPASRKKSKAGKATGAKKRPAARAKKPVSRRKPASRSAGKKAVSRSKARPTGKSTAVRKKAKSRGGSKATTTKKAAAKTPASRRKKAASPTAAMRPRPTATRRKAATRRAATGKRPESLKPAARRAERRSAGSLLAGPGHGIKPYQPRRGEAYMGEGQLEHFRRILQAWKRELMEEVDRTVHHMKDEAANFPDPNDRATQESEFSLELRTRDRERKLIKKIDEALATVESGDYGYCESCGVEIGIRRLEARPTATLCIDCKTLDEIREKQMGG
jgi:DnaK suppressor protein